MATGRRVNLLGGEGKAALDRKRVLRMAAIGGAVLVVLLGGLWFLRKSSLDDEKSKLAKAQAETTHLQAEIAKLADAQTTQTQVETLRTQVQTLLATDVSWSRMLQEIARTIPSDTWLTAFQGSSTPPAPVTAVPVAPAAPVPGDTSATTATTAARDRDAHGRDAHNGADCADGQRLRHRELHRGRSRLHLGLRVDPAHR